MTTASLKAVRGSEAADLTYWTREDGWSRWVRGVVFSFGVNSKGGAKQKVIAFRFASIR